MDNSSEGFESNSNPLVGNSDDGVSRVTLQQTESAPNRDMSPEEAQNRSKTDQELYSADNLNTNPDVDQNRVEEEKSKFYAGKFKSAEDLEKAYTELSKKLGNSNDTTTETKAEAETEQTIDSTIFSKATTEWEETGEISKDSFDAFSKAGIPEDVVNQYLANANAQQELQKSEILETIGGQNEFNKMSNWAQSNLPKDEIDGFNSIISTGDIGQIKLVLGTLKSRMGQTTFVQPDSNNNSRSDRGAYQSKAEMTAAINDSRYDKDTAYRNNVARRIMSSKNL